MKSYQLIYLISITNLNMWEIAEMEKYATDLSLHRLIKGPMFSHHIQIIQFYGSAPQINNKFTFVHITINSQE